MRQNGIGRHDYIRKDRRKGPLRAVERARRETRREPRNLVAPLAHYRLGNDHQRLRLGVNKHSRNKLDGLTETHFVTQEPARLGPVEFPVNEPPYTLMLIRRNEAGLQHFESALHMMKSTVRAAALARTGHVFSLIH